MLRNNKKRANTAAHDRATFQNTEKQDCLSEKSVKLYSLSSEGVREEVVVGREMTVEALKNKLNSE